MLVRFCNRLWIQDIGNGRMGMFKIPIVFHLRNTTLGKNSWDGPFFCFWCNPLSPSIGKDTTYMRHYIQEVQNKNVVFIKTEEDLEQILFYLGITLPYSVLHNIHEQNMEEIRRYIVKYHT